MQTLHINLRQRAVFHRLTIVTNILMAIAFIPTGLVKLLGRRFASPDLVGPVGDFFEAMYSTGFFWNFGGLAQFAVGVLLIIPRTQALGSVAFFPLMLGITVVTWSIDFGLTKFITLLMLGSSLYLLVWHYDRWHSVVSDSPLAKVAHSSFDLPALEQTGLVAGASAGIFLSTVLRVFSERMSAVLVVAPLAIGLMAALLVLISWISQWRSSSHRAATPELRQQ